MVTAEPLTSANANPLKQNATMNTGLLKLPMVKNMGSGLYIVEPGTVNSAD